MTFLQFGDDYINTQYIESIALTANETNAGIIFYTVVVTYGIQTTRKFNVYGGYDEREAKKQRDITMERLKYSAKMNYLPAIGA